MEFDWISATAIVIGNIFCYLLGRYTRIKDMENIVIIRRKDTGEVVTVAICDDEEHIKRVLWEKEK